MNDSEADVYVEKTVEDRADIEVRLHVRSDREGATRVSFVEHLPESLPAGALTFGSTRWAVDDEAGNRLRWTDTVVDEAVAGYGLCLPTELDGDAFRSAPSIELVDELRYRGRDRPADAEERFGALEEETTALDPGTTSPAECDDEFAAFADSAAFEDLISD